MNIFTAQEKIGDIKRLRFIVATIFENGFGFLFTRARLTWIVPLECKVRCYLKACFGLWSAGKADTDTPARLRDLLIKLGPTFVKLGQVLSLRSDLLPTAVTKELSSLTNQVPPFPYAQAKQTIESELGKSIAELFKEFEEVPLAAASLAQVHRAVLRDGTEAAVKVLRPDIRELVEKDIHILRYLAAIAEKRVPRWKIYRLVRTVDEFADTIRRELDLTVEAIHAKRFEAMFAEDDTVRVAHVYAGYSSKSVLTMDLISGIRLDNPAALRKNRIDRKVLAQNGVNALLRQVFVEGFFHADPHPGNYFALPGNVFAFIDYGMVGRLSPRDRREIAAFFVSFISQDQESAIKHLKHLVEFTPASNIPSFEHDIDDILHEWFGTKLKDVSLADSFYRILESGRQNEVYFPPGFAILVKALYTTEAMGSLLDPDFDFARQMKPFASKIIKQDMNPKKLAQKLQNMGLDYFSYIDEAPEQLMRALKVLSTGRLDIHIDSREMASFSDNLRRQAAKTLVTAIASSVLVVSGLLVLLQNGQLALHWNVAGIAMVALAVLLGWSLLRRPKG